MPASVGDRAVHEERVAHLNFARGWVLTKLVLKFFTEDFFRGAQPLSGAQPRGDFADVHLTVFLVVTLVAGRIIASRDHLQYLDGWFFSVSAITAGGLVPGDMSRLSRGSEVILWLLFTFGGVTFTALPPMLWRIWLFRARFRPLIAEAQELTSTLAAARAEEAAMAVRVAALLAEAAADVERRHKAAVAKAQAAWSATDSAIARAAAAAEAEAESGGDTMGSVKYDLAAGAAGPSSSGAPAGASQWMVQLSRVPSAPDVFKGAGGPLRRTLSFFQSAAGGSDAPGDEARAAAAETAAEEATRAAAAAAAFSEEDAADYAALSTDFEAQNEALVSLAAAVAFYVLGWHLFGALAFGTLYLKEGPHLPVLIDRRIRTSWLSIFLVSSALNNTGLSLLDDSLVSLGLRPQSLMVLAAAILAGNTAWPVALRAMLRAWVGLCGLLGGPDARSWRVCRGVWYALEHPQRCYHLLFDARATAAVAFAVVAVTAFQLIFFYATSITRVTADLNEFAAEQGLPRPSRAMIGTTMFFQVVSVRSAGFQVVDIKRITDVMGVLFAFMFWFAPHPFVAALNEADESARLGIAARRAEEDDVQEAVAAPAPSAILRAADASAPYSVAVAPRELISARTLRFRPGPGGVRSSGVATSGQSLPLAPSVSFLEVLAPALHGKSATAAAHASAAAAEAEARGRHTLRGVVLRRYVARHTTWIFFGYITVACAEQHLLDAPPVDPFGRSPTSLFAILFELLSAYGTNGLSFGYPGVNYNLVGMWQPISKLVIIGLLFLGRHRNMPRAVDRPLAAHVRTLDGIVQGLRSAERAQRRALAALLAAEADAAASAAERAAGQAPAALQQRPGSAAEAHHVSLEAALAVVHAHVAHELEEEKRRSHDAGGDALVVAVRK